MNEKRNKFNRELKSKKRESNNLELKCTMPENKNSLYVFNSRRRSRR